MSKLNQVLDNRLFMNKSKPFIVFENKLIEAHELERRVQESKFSKKNKNQAKNQFIVFLVSCLESYLQDMCRLMIDKKLITLDKLLKIKKLKGLKYGLLDINTIQNEKISISEIVSNEMNFQNMKDIRTFCSLIDFDKHFVTITKDFKIKSLALPKEKAEESLHDFINTFIKQKNKSLENIKISHSLAKLTVRYMYQKMDFNKTKIFNTIDLNIQLRHKIVHKAAVLSIPNWQPLALMLGTVQFCAVIQEIYNIKSGKVKSSR